MDRLIQMIGGFSLLLLLFYACQPDIDAIGLPSDPKSDVQMLQSFLTRNGAANQSFTVNASTNSTITGSQGTQVRIPADAFVLPNGQPVTGNIRIELKEVLSKADMILAGMPTVSGDKLLVSGGEFYLRATLNGQRLTAVKPLTITVPAASSDPQMELFFASFRSDSTGSPTDTTRIPDWQPADTTVIFPPDTTDGGGDSIRVDTLNQVFVSSNQYVVHLYSNTLGWVNCNYFWNVQPATKNVRITTSNNPSPEQATVYLIFQNFNAVASFNSYSRNDLAYRSWYSFPVGYAAKAIGFTVKDGKFYYGEQDVTVSNGLTVNLNFREVTEAELITALRAL